MPWDSTRPGSNPKYATKEHRAKLAEYKRALKTYGVLTCTANECLFGTRDITNPRGRERDGLHAGHNDDGVTYRGPQHNACNVRDGSKRGRAMQEATSLDW